MVKTQNNNKVYTIDENFDKLFYLSFLLNQIELYDTVLL